MTTTPDVPGSREACPSWADVLELVASLDAAPYADVDLRLPGLHLQMSTSPLAFDDAGSGAAADATAVTAVTATPAAAGPEAPAASAATGDGASSTSTVDVVAPMLGTFYRRPSPDAPPFVETGGTVEPDTTIAIVEVMKLMNPVTAGVTGRVVEVCTADGDLVEHGDVLFRVEPAETL